MPPPCTRGEDKAGEPIGDEHPAGKTITAWLVPVHAALGSRGRA